MIGYGLYFVRLDRNFDKLVDQSFSFHGIEIFYSINIEFRCRLPITDNNDERIRKIRTN